MINSENRKSLKSIGLLLILVLITWACQDNDSPKLNSEQAKVQTTVAAKDNATIIASTQDALELTSQAFDDEGLTSARTITSGRLDGHFHGDKHDCQPSVSGSYSIDNSHKDTLIYSGSMTIDYGDGSTCKDTVNVHKGKLTNAFTLIVNFHDSLSFSSTQTLTFLGFIKDTTTLDGTFITKKASGKPATVEADNAKITYPDGTSTSWSGTLTYTYDKGNSCQWRDNTVHVTGSINGKNRNGVNFTATITQPLVYKYGCDIHHHFVPVSGTIELSLAGVISTIDFGDGSCDKKYTITTNGTVTEYKFDGYVDND